MKLESLVIADQHAAVNTFSGLVHTARHTMRVDNTRSRWPNRKGGAVEGRIDDWGQVVTRYPYENVGMDHLLSKEQNGALNVLGRVSETAGSEMKKFIEERLRLLFGFQRSIRMIWKKQMSSSKGSCAAL